MPAALILPARTRSLAAARPARLASCAGVRSLLCRAASTRRHGILANLRLAPLNNSGWTSAGASTRTARRWANMR